MSEKTRFYLDQLTVPIEVLLNKELDKTCCFLFPLIKLLDNSQRHCFASNFYLSQLLNTSEHNISNSVSLLIKQGYVDLVSFDGRTRVIKINKDYLTTHHHLKIESDNRIDTLKNTESLPSTVDQPLPDKNTETEGENDAAEGEGNSTDQGSIDQSIKEIKDNSLKNTVDQFYGTSYCGEASASPRKKIKIDRTKPLVIIPEPDKIFSKPIIRKSHFVPKKKSEVVKEIFDYWAKKGLPVHEEKSRSESTAIYYLEELLNGTLFKDRFRDEGVIRKYSVREIKQAIDNFALKARNPDYEPTNKDWLRHVYLNTFFYNPKIGTEEKKSIFLDSLFNKPVMLANSRIFAAKDEVPHITNMLVDWYKRVFRNRIESVGFSIKNRNDCVYAGKELKNFLEENKGRLNLNNDSKRIHGQHDDLSLLAFLLTKAMDKELRENEGLYPVFHTGWLHSERTITERLPKILREERIMK